MDYGNSYTPDQINAAYAQLLNSGTSVKDIITGAKNNFGIGADQMIAAQHFRDPTQNVGTDNYIRSLYGNTGTQSPAPTPSGIGGGSAMPTLNTSYTPNPYLQQQADDITRRVNLSRDMGLQGIAGNAVGVGGLGGTRQGVAEGLGIGQAADNLAGQLSGLYGGDYTNQMNRNLQQYGIDSSNYLGARGLDNQRYGQDQNFYTQQRGQDQQGALIGASLYDKGTNGQFNPLVNSNSIYSPYTGYGTTSNNASTGFDYSKALGNAGAAYQYLNTGAPRTTANSFGGVNSGGFGTGAGYGNLDYGQYF